VSSLDQIGQKLKNARESRGLTLGAIYDKTKIPTSNLEAIENGDASQLPEPVYVSGFIKRYADCVGLNGQSLAEEYKNYIEEANDNGRGFFAAFSPEKKSKSVAVQSPPVITPSLSKVKIMEPPRPGFVKTIFWPSLLIVMVLVGMGYVVIYQNQIYMSSHDPSLNALRESTSRYSQVQPATPPTPVTSTAQAPGVSTPNAERDCRVSLSASQHVWIEVKSVATGESLFTGFLEAGDRRDFQDLQGLKVRAGNGASINVSYRGKHETFGPAGQRVDRVFMAASPAGGEGLPQDGSVPAGDTALSTTVKPVTAQPVKRVRPGPRPKVEQAPRRIDTAPSRYIPGESLGGTRSIGQPYRYTDGRLDSE
jgi:cytoskeletal protein RodZ